MEVGKAAIKAYFTNGAPNFPHMVIKSDSLVAYGQTAVDVGTVTLHPKEGGELVNRYLVVLRRTYQAWHVVRVMVVPVEVARLAPHAAKPRLSQQGTLSPGRMALDGVSTSASPRSAGNPG